MHNFLQTIANTIRRHRLLQPGEHVLVALSGGADSVALLAALRQLGYWVEAAHCNFHLRGAESDRDERFCRELCDKWGVPIHVRAFSTKAEAEAHGESIEMAARRLRYAWFSELLAGGDIKSVAVAHHRDDNVETLFLNLLRGTGIHGCTGMSYHRDNVVRPLLDVGRADILAFLEAQHQPFVTDSSNADTHYKRNLIRHKLTPLLKRLNPSAVSTLVSDMQRLQAAGEAYDAAVHSLLIAPEYRTPIGYRFPLSALTLRAHFDGIGEAFGFPYDTVNNIFANRGTNSRAIYESPSHLAAFYRGNLEVVRRPSFSPVVLQAGRTVRLPDGRHLSADVLPREESPMPARERNIATLDADKIRLPLTVRPVAPADRFVPFGMKGEKLVSDVLTDAHVSQLSRLHSTVVTDAGGIVWLTGHRPAQRCAITDDTQRVLILTLF